MKCQLTFTSRNIHELKAFSGRLDDNGIWRHGLEPLLRPVRSLLREAGVRVVVVGEEVHDDSQAYLGAQGAACVRAREKTDNIT